MKTIDIFTLYYNIELNTDTAHNYLSSKYLTGLIIEWYSGDLEKMTQNLKFYKGMILT